MKLGLKENIPSYLLDSLISPHEHEYETTTRDYLLFFRLRTGWWEGPDK